MHDMCPLDRRHRSWNLALHLQRWFFHWHSPKDPLQDQVWQDSSRRNVYMQNTENTIFANNQSPLNTLHIRNITKHAPYQQTCLKICWETLCCYTQKHPSCGRSSFSNNTCGTSTTGSWLLNINVLLLPLLVNAPAIQLSIMKSQTRKITRDN